MTASSRGSLRVGEPATTWREVLALAFPAVVSGFVQMAYHWVNQVWVGRLPEGTTATAALSVAQFAVWAYFAATSLVGAGLAALVGRYVGAGRPAVGAWIASQGLRWSVALAAVVGSIGFLLAPWVHRVAQVSSAAADLGTLYVRIFFAGGVTVFLQAACDAIWRGRGETRIPLLTAAAGLTLNAVLDPLLIFGFGPLRGFGVPGAALATVISAGTATGLSLLLLRRAGCLSGRRPEDADLRLFADTPLAPGPWPAFDLSVLRRLVRIGAPLAASGFFFVGVYLGISRIVTRAGGDAAQAALGIGLRGEQVAWFVGQGFSVAAASLVARRLGAGRPDDAARAAWTATLLASLGCLAWSLTLLLAPEALARLFLPGAGESLARSQAIEYYGLVALCLVPQCWEIVLDGAFAGAGLTIPPMVVSVGLTASRLPLAQWAAFDLGLGVRGVWIVIVVTAGLRGLVTAAWFARGTWKQRRV